MPHIAMALIKQVFKKKRFYIISTKSLFTAIYNDNDNQWPLPQKSDPKMGWGLESCCCLELQLHFFL